MAEPQLEKGHVRIANDLYDAIQQAPFHGDLQRRQVWALARLTFGWGKRTVEISVSQLAQQMHTQCSGRFREALAQLIEAGVVRVLRRGRDAAKPSVFTLNKNFEAWGQYSLSAVFLKARWGERPRSVDELIGLDDGPEGASEEAPSSSQGTVPADRHTLYRDGARPQAESQPVHRQGASPHTGTVRPRKSRPVATYEAGKTGKPGQTESSTTARENSASPQAGQRSPEIVLAAAANAGLLEHVTPERRQLVPRIIATSGNVHEAVQAITQAGVPIAFAESQIFELARVHTADGEIKSLKYFVAPVIRRWEEQGAASQRDESTIAERSHGVIARQLWDVIKRRGLATCHPQFLRQRIEAAVASGEISSGEQLAEVLAKTRSTLATAKTDHYAEKAIAEALTHVAA